MSVLNRLKLQLGKILAPAAVELQPSPAFMEAFAHKLSQINLNVGKPHPYNDLNFNIGVITQLLIADYYDRHLLKNPKYTESKRITHHIAKFYSMQGEDGIIREICHRIGIDNGYFVEFGVDIDGLENNTLYLLHRGWSGLWIEAQPTILEAKRTTFAKVVEEGRLTIVNERVTAENIDGLIRSANPPSDIDVLSIDIDGNDYWVWRAITSCKPKVVAVEYNSVLGDDVACVIPYSPDFQFSGSYYMGASLKALEQIGREKGYSLVGCDFQGVNAYFVRDDLVGEAFEAPFTTKNHFEPLRVFLTQNPGSWRGYGQFEYL